MVLQNRQLEIYSFTIDGHPLHAVRSAYIKTTQPCLQRTKWRHQGVQIVGETDLGLPSYCTCYCLGGLRKCRTYVLVSHLQNVDNNIHFTALL